MFREVARKKQSLLTEQIVKILINEKRRRVGTEYLQCNCVRETACCG